MIQGMKRTADVKQDSFPAWALLDQRSNRDWGEQYEKRKDQQDKTLVDTV